jgi:hypothetical protein
MLDEENDKRIKEAADHYHPEYDDTAWQKMEQLLDEHLPVEKKRKRLFFLIPLALFIGCLLLLIGLYNWKNNKPFQNGLSKNKTEKATVTNPANDSKKITEQTSLESKKNVATISKEKKVIEKSNTNSVRPKSVNTQPVSSSVNQQNRNAVSATENDLSVKQIDESKKEAAIAKENNRDEINHEESSISEKTIQENKSNVLTPDEKDNKVGEEKSSRQNEMVAQNNIAKTGKPATKNISKKTNKTTYSFANNFGVSISAGPDISGVHDNKIGKLTLAYGAGISYAISKKLNLRTGFYLSKKIYSVDPKDYKIPAGSLGNYEYLQNVDANCKVYEIPVKLDYNFGKTKNHNWFVSGGLSSYLMKKENYQYYFKTPTGQVYDKDWGISNKNKHFFSVLSVSGGYQYSLNKQFSIIAEPYVNLPLTGIGAGKVKLNSGGILFTIKAKPFLKKQ